MSDRKDLPARLGALAGDVIGVLGLPGNVIGTVLQQIMERRLGAAREILIEEISHGDRDLHDAGQVDEVVAILHRYARAAQEGAARLNLRLLAKVISGQAATGPLYADEFLRYADILAGMRREEIVLVAAMCRHARSEAVLTAEHGAQTVRTMQAAIEDLVPAVLATEDEFFQVASATLRTGLLLAWSGYGGLVYRITPLAERVQTLASFEAAIDAEDELGRDMASN